jgi:hypothetical protein
MTVFTEGRKPAEGILSEANGQRSRDNVVITAGSGVIAPMTVLGRIISGAVAVVAGASGAGKGALTLATPAFGPDVKAGIYRVIIVEPVANLGNFTVEDPDGNTIGSGVVGTPFVGPIRFTVADGATDHAAGDIITVTVTVAAGSGKLVPSSMTATDGSQNAVAIAIYGGDATSADLSVAALVRDAEVRGSALTYHSTVDTAPERAAKAAQLAAVGIIVR